MRCSFISSYTDTTENDYMTISANDTPEETASIVIKMIAVGVPTYSNRFDNMPQTHKDIQKHYHRWYNDRLSIFKGHRTPLDTELCIWKAGEGETTAYFVLNSGRVIDTDETKFEVLNATFQDHVFIKNDKRATFKVKSFDMYGNNVNTYEKDSDQSVCLKVSIGGRLEIIQNFLNKKKVV